MIWHQTIGKKIDLEAVKRLIENPLEGFVVGWLVKDRRSEVGTIEHVVAIASGIGSFGSSHISSLASEIARRKHKQLMILPSNREVNKSVPDTFSRALRDFEAYVPQLEFGERRLQMT